MPTGALSALPLQACTDSVVSAGTTTLRALVDARDPQDRPAPQGGPVVVAAPQVSDLATLHAAAAEADTVAGLLDGVLDGRCLRLSDADATPARVLEALHECSHVHFACHARSDPSDPASAALLVTGGRLAVRDIAALPRRRRSLAYLSACDTAFSDGLLTDEAMHLVSAFQLAGFRSVVGTLWRLGDGSASVLAEEFYASLRQGRDPAAALHDAVRVLRERYPQNPLVWAGHVYVGA